MSLRRILSSLLVSTAIVPVQSGANPQTVYEVFSARSGWNTFPRPILDLLAQKFPTVESASEFANLCEQTGVLKNNFVKLTKYEPPLAVFGMARTLSSYANSMGDQRRFDDAKRGLEYALILEPRHLPSWSSMAILSANTGNCRDAVLWADKVLQFKVDPTSSDFIDKANAELVASEALREPMARQLEEIKQFCRDKQ